ncbi:MAG: aminoacyl-tRNA hydrolase [Alphaproteobacteria bacterium]|jgi:PTH1 family peptidyl-tRNA hydrolase|nr:aminoacyl-tRNA hydrolase [Alphaproteobacteria bacterium]|tara:strand:- start:798 stop:1346 length:549 start_codon:yes stop_codon:yes gene_type:complete
MLTLYCLGNPTLKHKQNRHNAGLLLGDYLVKKLNLNLKKFKHYKLSNTFQIDGTQCQIALSENYMNESGNGVLSLKTTKLSKSDELFVLYDELDLSLGEIKIKYSGGNAGHNGLRSISSKIGDNYWKLRIGVDHPGDKEQVTRHVLGNFKENEKKILNNLFELIYLNLSQIFISRHLSNLGI